MKWKTRRIMAGLMCTIIVLMLPLSASGYLIRASGAEKGTDENKVLSGSESSLAEDYEPDGTTACDGTAPAGRHLT